MEQKNTERWFPEFMTKKLAGEYLGIDANFIKELCDSGELITVYPKANNHIWKRGLIPKQSCNDYRDRLIVSELSIPKSFLLKKRI
jgi:hypothetical protein